MSNYDPDWPGKGDWNRQRNMTKYAENKDAIEWTCKECDGLERVHTPKGIVSCPVCCGHVKSRVCIKAGVTRTVYK